MSAKKGNRSYSPKSGDRTEQSEGRQSEKQYCSHIALGRPGLITRGINTAMTCY